MPIAQAQQWLKKHSFAVPALECNIQQIYELLKEENKSPVIAQYAENDPGLTLALLKKVNGNRGGFNSEYEIVDSSRSAISLLGQPSSFSMFKRFDVAESLIKDPQQLFLFHQLCNRGYHNAFQIGEWARELGHHQIDQLKLSAMLYYTGELLCCLHDYSCYLEYIDNGSQPQSEEQYFGFTFSELTEVVGNKLHLPDPLLRSQPHIDDQDHRIKMLRLVSSICHLSELGWYHDSIQTELETFADYQQIPAEKVITKFHLFSVAAARQACLTDTWQPACRLILTADGPWSPTKHPVAAPVKSEKAAEPVKVSQQKIANNSDKVQAEKPEQQMTIFERIRHLLEQPDTSQSAILSNSLAGLIKDLQFKRASLLFLSRDKLSLQNRMSQGVPKQSSFHNYQTEVNHSGLLKILLKKPQAIWISPDNFEKYQKLIPPELLKSTDCHDFVAMSLFIGEKPIGIVYADRYNSTPEIDKHIFGQFKQLISLTSQALKMLSTK